MTEEEAIRRGFIQPPPAPPEPVRPPVPSVEDSLKILAEARQGRTKSSPLFTPSFKRTLIFIAGWLIGFMCGLTF